MTTNWNLYGASVAGKGHIVNNLPCQDAHSHVKINRRWIIAVTSDGAVSYPNSELGATFIVKNIKRLFKNQIIGNKIFFKNSIPKTNEWRKFVLALLYKTANNLKDFSKKNGIEYKSLSCTVNLALISDDLILTANIGDGRACYKSQSGDWLPMMIPFKGNEVGSTVFITTDWIWNNEAYINTQVIKDKAIAFALLSDGLEKHSFLCYTKNDEGFYCDPNNPFPKFFDTNIYTLRNLKNAGLTNKQIKLKLENYLKNSNYFINELDDKTLLVGFVNN